MKGMDQGSAFALWHEATLKAIAHRLLCPPALAHSAAEYQGGSLPAPSPSIVLQVSSRLFTGMLAHVALSRRPPMASSW